MGYGGTNVRKRIYRGATSAKYSLTHQNKS